MTAALNRRAWLDDYIGEVSFVVGFVVGIVATLFAVGWPY